MLASSVIFKVSELCQAIQTNLESDFAWVQVLGEISNFKAYPSGHFYFSLKDENAQIAAVMFKGANRILKFKPEDGLEVVLQGRLTLYEVRGQLQIVVESMEPKGLGALQLAFEQLKEKLSQEGLFETKYKKALPFFPKIIGLVTSEKGAALRDLLQVLKRRHPRLEILLTPCLVQGEDAPQSIAQAIALQNQYGKADLLIVGRGGGSLEDLMPFNSEIVARTIFASQIPIISAVGHETDFSIADFVADLRAPTPSAAAELAVPVLSDLEEKIFLLKRHLKQNITARLEQGRLQIKFLKEQLKSPKRFLEERAQRLSELEVKLEENLEVLLKSKRDTLNYLETKLDLLSPLNTLKRGYAVVQKKDSKTLVQKSSQVKAKDQVLIRVAQGSFEAQVL
ncbi:MAG: exodeoxyribonuclease VII large subunit [Deltaproteobacteria bacterium]|nr:exodeoxyribonuclease VII large subunit [Deltaproteobacteria bacterium]